MQDREGWCQEVSHEDFDEFLFFKQQMVFIEEEGDEEAFSKQHHKLKREWLQGESIHINTQKDHPDWKGT